MFSQVASSGSWVTMYVYLGFLVLVGSLVWHVSQGAVWHAAQDNALFDPERPAFSLTSNLARTEWSLHQDALGLCTGRCGVLVAEPFAEICASWLRSARVQSNTTWPDRSLHGCSSPVTRRVLSDRLRPRPAFCKAPRGRIVLLVMAVPQLHLPR